MFEGAESSDICCGCGGLLVGRLKVSLAFEVNMIAVISFHSNQRTSEALFSFIEHVNRAIIFSTLRKSKYGNY